MQLEELKTYEPAPAGTHLAILVKLIDLGIQENTFASAAKAAEIIGDEIPF